VCVVLRQRDWWISRNLLVVRTRDFQMRYKCTDHYIATFGVTSVCFACASWLEVNDSVDEVKSHQHWCDARSVLVTLLILQHFSFFLVITMEMLLWNLFHCHVLPHFTNSVSYKRLIGVTTALLKCLMNKHDVACKFSAALRFLLRSNSDRFQTLRIGNMFKWNYTVRWSCVQQCV
jgi:hypothetical protein